MHVYGTTGNPFDAAFEKMAGNPGYSMGTVAGTDIPVEHLDYGYIGKSKNARELEEIVKVLRRVSLGGAWIDAFVPHAN